MLLLSLWACVPDTFDVSADDYLTRQPSPEAMVSEDGLYNGGWYDSFTGRINPEDALGHGGAYKGWLHFSLQNEDQLISVNLADLNNVGNTAILVMDTHTGDVKLGSINRSFGQNTVEVNADITEVVDTVHGDYIRLIDDGLRLEFGLAVGGLSIEGTAARLFADEFVQISRFHDGYGQLQWYGKLQVEEAVVFDGEREFVLGPETLGAYDRMAGHRRTEQAWNWVTTVGTATRVRDGHAIAIGVEITTEREGSRPQVDVKKHGVWIGDTFTKIPSAHFEFEKLNEDGTETTEWVIASDPGDEDRVDLVFEPIGVRSEDAGYLWFYYSEFRQYVGTLSGTLTIDGEEYRIEGLPAVAEDSLLIL